MSDPLLTTLCSICHVSEPKYKCPRCGIQTCSLGCITKHKSWSECNGERDPTAYVPKSKLRTVGGIDHDYNFLHGLGLSVERAERVLVRDKGLVQPQELRPRTVEQTQWKTGRDGRKRKVAVTKVLHESKERRFERCLAQRLRFLNVQVECAPTGLSRQKENKTTFNRKTGMINWQVEWVLWHDERSQADETRPTAARVLSKVLEDVPLYLAYEAATHDTGEQPRGARRIEAPQAAPGSAWSFGTDSTQEPSTGCWTSHHGADVGSCWPSERDDKLRKQFSFFLAGAPGRADRPSTVAALDEGACLRDILSNTRVREFPTVFVLKAGESVPAGFILGPKESIPRRQSATARHDGPETGANKTQRPAKRRKTDEAGLGEDEAGSGGNGVDGESKGAIAAGTQAEEEDGELKSSDDDDGDDGDDDDSTSSSASTASDAEHEQQEQQQQQQQQQHQEEEEEEEEEEKKEKQEARG
ncbi:hypothetical protein DCS_07199 [Drechmeria coniospora]|uniref:Box C/D snoRNA protein 1 n=1 Tax=Drechmeria coniospora TaxID=98403 RepID=A0A151GDQ5_DRECN|nr:hypothetical protein DCS_07199 [Drechmeria coniospora]KYK55237.1 hypothetical protein DCS_07199 [Drechmeria coniospora]